MDERHFLDPRRALEIQRYHTYPHIRDQSIGEHSAQVARIVLTIEPDIPRHVLVHIMNHDIGEQQTGDLPFHAKRDCPELKRIVDVEERRALQQMKLKWRLPGPQTLTEYEETVFKMADWLDMLEWALEEMNLGNRCASLVASRIRDRIRDKCDELSAAGGHTQFLFRVSAYIEDRDAHEEAIFASRERD